MKENYEYGGGDLAISLSVNDFVTSVYNLTLSNTRLEPGYYYQENNKLFIRESYFKLLPNSGTYEFKIVGASLTFIVKVDVTLQEDTFAVSDVTIESGTNVVVYVGNNVINSVKVNGNVLDLSKYEVKDYTLNISHEVFNEGENTVLLNDSVSFKVTVVNLDEEVTEQEESSKKKSGFMQWLTDFFKKIGDFFKNLFGGKKNK